ncbi:MAG: hypothetical protein J7L38_01060 [Thermoproteales archaeon]|nr:hypothetical protein [Thermoproteales archaeon]RLE65881.1 MAG: hypothetical protein DRJ47_03905 [Thermoprotei archaeon]
MVEICFSREGVKKILDYALAHCRDECPEKRDPYTCVILVKLREILGLEPPPCIEDYGGFDEKTFTALIKDIEKRWGMGIEDVLKELKSKGARTLQDKIDLVDAEFALTVLRILKNREEERFFKVQ